MSALAAAISVKPNKAATREMRRKIIAHFKIVDMAGPSSAYKLDDRAAGSGGGALSYCFADRSVDDLDDLLLARIDQHDLIADRKIPVGTQLRIRAHQFFRYRLQRKTA